MALRRWSGIIAYEGVQTGDGRIINEGALTFDTPQPLAWMVEGTQHVDLSEVAPTIGTIDEISRGDGGAIVASGSIDDENPHGAEAIRQMEAAQASHGREFGISIDLDDMAVEIWFAPWPEDEDDGDIILAAGRRVVVEGMSMSMVLRPQRAPVSRAVVAAAGEPMPDDFELGFEMAMDEIIDRCLRGRIRGATLVATPAFDQARIGLDVITASSISIDASKIALATGGPIDLSKVAGMGYATRAAMEAEEREHPAPVNPPAAWFADPAFLMPTPLTITREGRVMGHLAAWGTCHTAFEECVLPPSGGDYSTFHGGSVLTEDETVIRTGGFAWGIPHASLSQRMLEAFAHYEMAQYGFCDVRVGEDDHGVWFSGSLRPGLTFEDVRVLRALSISGDWRRRTAGGPYNLIAGLAVNFPGFPIPEGAEDMGVVAGTAPRVQFNDPETFTEPMALVAAGMVPQAANACGCGTALLEVDEIGQPEWAARLEGKLDRLLRHTGEAHTNVERIAESIPARARLVDGTDPRPVARRRRR